MKILVCIKQVPDMESRFRVSGAGDWFEEGDLAFRMNEYDEYAVEQAVRLKEQLGDLPEITVLSIGPDRVGEAIRKALAMGCDRGVHLQDPEASRKDPWQIASLIAAFARDQGFDLVFTGMQSQDRGSAQVGIMVAELLGYPCVSTIVGFAYDNGVITVRRELEGGTRGVVKLGMPAVVTCQLGLNVPRYPTLPNIMKAKKKEILPLATAGLSGEERRAVTLRLHRPEKRGGGVVMEGEVNDMAERLVGILKQKAVVPR
ncbi:electron transfer flavoprotein subunit beta/FixA family protein [Geobacter pickeringii]|uniref:Electron transfer flavoprotein subunit beta n=1 Tax=Geobacter pickeringii TaxID=345632 RepID=A0A0B5BDA3_9BACT|nr:electron transfer flavoprotein subunit beta/FixA family protein [Geobacter pickeringii]AJE04703.1 electron transfer flavoprotein subunit beta [Geobacter pickeringii]